MTIHTNTPQTFAMTAQTVRRHAIWLRAHGYRQESARKFQEAINWVEKARQAKRIENDQPSH